MPHGREIGTVAAELLKIFSGSAESEVPATAEHRDAEASVPVMKTAADIPELTPDAVPVVWGAEMPEYAETLRQNSLQIPERSGIQTPAELGADGQRETAAWSVLHVQKAPELQQSMDDISEFFRRDSRRYDSGFEGGYGA